MEALVVTCCAGLAWMGSFVALGGGHIRLSTHTTSSLRRRLLVAADVLAESALISRIVGWEVPAHVCDAVVGMASRRGDLRMTRELACANLVVLVVLSALLCSLLVRSAIGALAVVVGSAVGTSLWDASRRGRQAQELSASMPGVFRTLAMALGAGETLMQSVAYVASHEEGPAGQAFVRATLRMRCGASAADALSDLSHELDAPGVGLLVTALLISQRTGSPLRGLFEHAAELVERSREFERLLQVKTAQVRLSVRIVCLMPVILVSVLSLLSPDFRRGLMTVPGAVSVAIAALMDALALLIIRRLMQGVL